MFDIGLPELIVVFVIVLLVVGPEDVPRILYRLGKFVRYVSGHWDSMRNALGDVMHEAELNEYRIKATEEKDKASAELLHDFEPEKALDEGLRPAAVVKANKTKKSSKSTKSTKKVKADE